MFPSMIYIAASLEEVMLCITFELPLLRRLHWPGCTELRSPKNLASLRAPSTFLLVDVVKK